MVLQRDFGSVLRLVRIEIAKDTQRRGGHGAGGADLRLAAALGTGDRGVAFDERPNQAGNRQCATDRFIAVLVPFLHISENRRQDAAGTAGRRSNNGTAVCVLLADCVGIGADNPAFPHLVQSYSTND